MGLKDFSGQVAGRERRTEVDMDREHNIMVNDLHDQLCFVSITIIM